MPSQRSTPNTPDLAAGLVDWFRKKGRDYPWRRTRDPYAILVSEVMLQQTQISTVLDRGYYHRWMTRFPDWKTLAMADETSVLSAWEGLGYYRRARNLQRLAQAIVSEHGGSFPKEHAVILDLPGVGPYTAGAVASFAFGQAHPIVDGNVARVLSRIFNDATPIDSSEGRQMLWTRAANLVQVTDDPRSLNSALMELGQTHCRPGRPDCKSCPVRGQCHATAPENLPVKSSRPPPTEVTERVVFMRTSGGILLEQETGSRRTGLWKLPALPDLFHDTPPPVLIRTNYGITRYKVTLWVHEPPRGFSTWPASHQVIPQVELAALPMPSPYRRALLALLKEREEDALNL
ncbi:MAG: A/G-specific adenine glycosylase [Prosthecobacter sp.]